MATTDPLTLEPVEPIGEREVFCVDVLGHGGLVPGRERLYPPPAFDLRAYRRERGIGLRDAARRLGITATETTGLERGSKRPVDGWDDVVRRLEDYCG